MKLVSMLVILLSLSLAACGGKENDSAKEQAELGLPTPAGPADEALGQIIVDFVAINEILGRVTNEETARTEVSALQKVIDRLSGSLEMAQNLPDDQKAQSRERYRQRLDEETLKFSQNIGRIMQEPAAAPLIMKVLESMAGLSSPTAGEAQPGESHEGHDHGPGDGHDHGSEAPSQAPAGGGH